MMELYLIRFSPFVLLSRNRLENLQHSHCSSHTKPTSLLLWQQTQHNRNKKMTNTTPKEWWLCSTKSHASFKQKKTDSKIPIFGWHFYNTLHTDTWAYFAFHVFWKFRKQFLLLAMHRWTWHLLQKTYGLLLQPGSLHLPLLLFINEKMIHIVISHSLLWYGFWSMTPGFFYPWLIAYVHDPWLIAYVALGKKFGDPPIAAKF